MVEIMNNCNSGSSDIAYSKDLLTEDYRIGNEFNWETYKSFIREHRISGTTATTLHNYNLAEIVHQDDFQILDADCRNGTFSHTSSWKRYRTGRGCNSHIITQDYIPGVQNAIGTYRKTTGSGTYLQYGTCEQIENYSWFPRNQLDYNTPSTCSNYLSTDHQFLTNDCGSSQSDLKDSCTQNFRVPSSVNITSCNISSGWGGIANKYS